jgi:hypothetical protein
MRILTELTYLPIHETISPNMLFVQNGGMITKGGNNWPLRGSKITVWEGGTRTIGFVSGSRLQKTGYTFDG